MAYIWHPIAFILEPLAWAFALWGVGLYWWGAFVYLRQLRAIVKKGA
jgi:cardiolipin synthase